MGFGKLSQQDNNEQFCSDLWLWAELFATKVNNKLSSKTGRAFSGRLVGQSGHLEATGSDQYDCLNRASRTPLDLLRLNLHTCRLVLIRRFASPLGFCPISSLPSHPPKPRIRPSLDPMESLAPSPPVHAISFAASSPLHPRKAPAYCSIKRNWRRARSFSGTLRCLVSIAAPTPTKPTPAEVSRTIMELSSVGTLSTLTHEGWPFGSGVRFAVDQVGTPILCLNSKNGELIEEAKSSLHVQVFLCIFLTFVTCLLFL